MLNVKMVQDNISKEYLEVVKKAPNSAAYYRELTYQERALLNNYSYSTLPRTCSAAEISMITTAQQLALRISQLLYSKVKYAQCSSTSRVVNELLEKFGFKQVTNYMGNHKLRVYIYYINLEKFRF